MGGPAAKNCDGNLIVSCELGTLVRSETINEGLYLAESFHHDTKMQHVLSW